MASCDKDGHLWGAGDKCVMCKEPKPQGTLSSNELAMSRRMLGAAQARVQHYEAALRNIMAGRDSLTQSNIAHDALYSDSSSLPQTASSSNPVVTERTLQLFAELRANGHGEVADAFDKTLREIGRLQLELAESERLRGLANDACESFRNRIDHLERRAEPPFVVAPTLTEDDLRVLRSTPPGKIERLPEPPDASHGETVPVAEYEQHLSLAVELEREGVRQVLGDVEEIAGGRTDTYWSAHSNACEEILHRLQTMWGATCAHCATQGLSETKSGSAS